jgi:hypothetical protein
MSSIKTIAFDFDGVLSEGAGYHWPLTGLDLSLIHQAHERGYAVVIMTCNDVRLVAAELNRNGISVLADTRMRYLEWHNPSVVLVTGRKVCADAYVDDRAIRYAYGEDPANVWTELAGRGLDSRGKILA